ncbi:UDP-N-acetylglucosamine 2-epimerase [Ruminococcaceae bacterium OttesenSCG-928-I18]|nr:UDP-N-acetylglucosamine 2-epimerase [Ruminococcaceae bacterium OttesenSCG-928-I18]
MEERQRYRLAVATGTRAEYGLLRPVLKKLNCDDAFDLRLYVTGSHLSEAFGSTVDEIEADGMPIAARLDILSAEVPSGRAGTAVRTQMALELFLAAFMEDKPDCLLLLGDRYEALAASLAASLLNLPVAHISGGEVTWGADDNWYRHCISKMAKLHFPSCEMYRQRLLRMGEQPGRVYNVGGLGDENIRNMVLPDRNTLAENLGIPHTGPFALVTYHPETATGHSVAQQADALLRAIEQHPELFYLFTGANADAGGSELNARYAAFCVQRTNCALFSSLGTLRYLGAMKEASLVLGNSSSGVVETPSLGTPTVNIGMRQHGRMICENVLCCDIDAGQIDAAIKEALTPAFREKARLVKSPYNGGDTSGRIVTVLKENLAGGWLRGPKTFYDGEGA